MKAYKASIGNGSGSTIVFAERPATAKVIALTCDCCEDARYIDVRVNRVPEADKLYRGRSEIDWYDPETRLFLVRDLGWACWETSFECESCVAKKFCEWWEGDDNNEERADNMSEVRSEDSSEEPGAEVLS